MKEKNKMKTQLSFSRKAFIIFQFNSKIEFTFGFLGRIGRNPKREGIK